MLAEETSFVLYLKQDDVTSKGSLMALCKGVSAGNLITSSAHAHITRLYKGAGGKIFEGQSVPLPNTGPVDSPPPYTDASPTLPAPPLEKGQ